MKISNNRCGPLYKDALRIATNPQPEHTARLRLLAWATLKSARGQTVCQRRLQTKPVQADRQVA